MTDRIVGVRGGPTSTAVVMADVDALGVAVEELAARCGADGRRLAAAASGASFVGDQLVPELATTAAAMGEAMRAVTGGAARSEAELSELAWDLRRAAAAYRQAEDEQVRSWRLLDLAAGCAVGVAGLPAVAGVAAALGVTGVNPLADKPDLVDHLVRGLPGAALCAATRLLPQVGPGLAGAAAGSPDGPVPLSAGLLAGLFTPGTYRVRELGPGPTVVPPASLADLARPLLPADQPPPGWLQVDAIEVTLPDGATHTTYQVVLPGTDDWSPPWVQRSSDAARDLGSNLELMAGRRTELTRSLPSVLDLAGVPPGADVVLIGHSQGGLVAYQAAGDAQLRARVHITDVVTFAAPLALMAPPKGVRVLSLENQRDVVPHADGQPNRERREHVTLTFDTGPVPAGGDWVGYPHGMEQYLRGADLFDSAAARGDPALAAVLQGLRSRLVLARRDQARTSRVRSSRRYQVSIDRGAQPPVLGTPR
ncbi:MAG TPA: hypothetical protein VFJ97_02710 [Dermatophilaceae bacterium]|nr:hypothetical protein [Dermatophilaceae bacterium]